LNECIGGLIGLGICSAIAAILIVIDDLGWWWR